MSRGSELDRVALLAAKFGRQATGATVGIGDDAAVLDRVDAPLVWTIDAQVEGTHFRLDWLSWQDVGWRSFMAAASDLGAMGASPIAALSALVLAGHVDDAALDALATGQAEAASVVGAPIVGGNLARGTEVSITTTVLGRAQRSILRSGARPGDGVFLAGPVGMAAAGLVALQRGAAGTNADVDACIASWRRPRALIAEGLAMSAVATAAVDISDGLSCDAARIAEASAVTLVLDEARLRAASSALERAAAVLAHDALDLALGGGEDYALLATSPSPIRGFERIGTVEAGPAGVVLARVVLARVDGARVPVDPRGFDHFR